MTEPVTVIVPVYDGLEQVRACLDSVVRHAPATTTPFELLVIDDALPRPGHLAPPRRLVAGRRPRPPVSTAAAQPPRTSASWARSTGRSRHSPGDVVLLNADTVVTEGWLDRMARRRHRPTTWPP